MVQKSWEVGSLSGLSYTFQVVIAGDRQMRRFTTELIWSPQSNSQQNHLVDGEDFQDSKGGDVLQNQTKNGLDWMIHGSRIPDPTNGQFVWSTWTSWLYFQGFCFQVYLADICR